MIKAFGVAYTKICTVGLGITTFKETCICPLNELNFYIEDFLPATGFPGNINDSNVVNVPEDVKI